MGPYKYGKGKGLWRGVGGSACHLRTEPRRALESSGRCPGVRQIPDPVLPLPPVNRGASKLHEIFLNLSFLAGRKESIRGLSSIMHALCWLLLVYAMRYWETFMGFKFIFCHTGVTIHFSLGHSAKNGSFYNYSVFDKYKHFCANFCSRCLG